MRRVLVPLLAAGLSCLTAAAQGQDAGLPVITAEPDALRPLATSDAIRPFAAVGRLDTGDGFCTATLIAPDLVLTAAHCLYAGSHEARRADSDFIFNAGLRSGRVSAQRGVRASFVHPGYHYGAPDHLERVRTDLALLRLDRPIIEAVTPFPAGGATAGEGDRVQVVSYGENREGFASLEEGCAVLAEDPGVFVLSCSVVQGASGAPVMVASGTGPQIVGVVSAAAHWRGESVALSASVEDEIERLMQMAGTRETGRSGSALPQLTGSAGSARSGLPQVRTLDNGQDGRNSTGARFLRP